MEAKGISNGIVKQSIAEKIHSKTLPAFFLQFLLVLFVLITTLLAALSQAKSQESIIFNSYLDVNAGEMQADPLGDIFIKHHPMNDAWMGMAVRTIDGKEAGYIADAVVNTDGSIDVLFIQSNIKSSLKRIIAVEPSYLILGDEYVTADMTLNTLYAQETANAYLESHGVE